MSNHIDPTYPVRKIIEALDLLDELVDPLTPLTFEQGVLQGRVQAWKAMLRNQVERAEVSPKTPGEIPITPAHHSALHPATRIDGLPPYGGG